MLVIKVILQSPSLQAGLSYNTLRPYEMNLHELDCLISRQHAKCISFTLTILHTAALMQRT